MIKKISIILVVLSLILIMPIHAGDTNDTAPVKSFTDLNDKITTENQTTIKLNDNYKYNKSSDDAFDDGVIISKNITLTGGNNAIIDANHQSRLLTVERNCNVILENLTFKNGFSNNSGGAILLKTNSNLTIKNCVFENNLVYNSNGGAIYAKSSTNINIINSLFTNNTSIRESELPWEEFKQGMGSAICVSLNSNLNLYNSTFRKNNAYLSTVLVISYSDTKYELSTLFVRNCTFENNTSKRSGVVYLDEYGKGEIYDSVFRYNNLTETAGTLILDSSVYALVKNCLFLANTAVRGGAINLRLFDTTGANVSIVNCNFTGNYANITGGAIYSNHANLTLINSTFNDNTARANGGAVYANEGILNITDCDFINNTSEHGGAISATSHSINLKNNLFKDNEGTVKGGAIYSKIDNIDYSNLTFINNTSPNGKDVYGAFNAEIKVIRSYFNDVELQVHLTSLWNLALNQKVKLKFEGDKNYNTNWVETDHDGLLTIKLPSNLNVGKYTVDMSVEGGFCNYAPESISIVKAPCKISVKKITTSYKSGKLLKTYVVNSKTGKKVAGAKLTLKIYKGKKLVKTYTLTSDKKGLVKFNTSKLDAGTYTIKITANNNNIKLSTVTSKITVKKASAKLSYAKKIKKGKKLKITVKNRNNKKIIKNSKFFIKIDKKSFYVKTNSKGMFKLSTKKLKKGKNKITIIRKSPNYNINLKISVKIK